jgi:DNA-binding transcriptional LysR family regulator
MTAFSSSSLESNNPSPLSTYPSPSTSRSSSLCELPFTLAQLAALQAVARTGSGVAAALTLGVSQPALESGLACGALLKPGRRGGPTSLTEAGAALLPHCERTLAAAREAARALSDLRAADAGSVRLGASQTVGTYVMPRILAAFRRANPRVTAQLVVDSSSAVCAAVASGVS